MESKYPFPHSCFKMRRQHLQQRQQISVFLDDPLASKEF